MRSRRFAVLGAAMGGAFVLLAGGPAQAERERHSDHLLSPARKPASVPSNYVVTRSGFFHPSCVVTVDSDEVVGADGVIRGFDGSEHARFSPCPYPRYSLRGEAVGGETPGAPAHAPPAAIGTYDGYIVYFQYEGAIAAGSSVSTEWTVPLEPTETIDQDIAFFNDILTTADGGDILQPVLDYNGEERARWVIESEHCCIGGNDVQTTPVVVNAGDVIHGIVSGAPCDPSGVCAMWSVTTTDVTTNQSTTLNTTAPTGIPNGVSPGSLETYGVTACDMFPASGEITFVDHAVTSPDGGPQKLRYDLIAFEGVAAEVPRNCGYSGSTDGGSYVLVFGSTPEGGLDASPDATTIDASDGGGADDATKPNDVDAAGDAAAVTAAATSTASSATSGAAASSGAGASTTSVSSASDSGASTSGRAVANGGGSSNGCACRTASRPEPGSWIAFASCAAVALLGRVRRGQRKSKRQPT